MHIDIAGGVNDEGKPQVQVAFIFPLQPVEVGQLIASLQKGVAQAIVALSQLEADKPPHNCGCNLSPLDVDADRAAIDAISGGVSEPKALPPSDGASDGQACNLPPAGHHTINEAGECQECCS